MQRRFRSGALSFAALGILASQVASRSFAADYVTIEGTQDDPAVTSRCALVLDPVSHAVAPFVTLKQVFPGTVVIRFSLFDASGTLVGKHDVAVVPPLPDGRLTRALQFTAERNFASTTCAVERDQAQAEKAGNNGTGLILGVVGGGALAALLASHGGSGSAAASGTVRPTAMPTPTPIPTLLPTATPSLASTSTPAPTPSVSPATAFTPTPAPTATASPTVPIPIPSVSLPVPVPSISVITLPPILPTATPPPTPTPTPIPTPTPTPTPTPLAGLSVTPASLAFTQTGASAAQTATAAEANYSGTFTAASSTCGSGSSAIASISPSPSSGAFSVTPMNAGSCSYTISDSNGQSVTLSIGVTTSSGVIHIKRRPAEPPGPPTPLPTRTPR